MKNNDIRIVFMGTPEFAVPALNRLIDEGFKVVGVVTSPDRPSGRGRKLTPSPVKQYALKNNLRILQPVKLRDPEFISQLKELSPDIQVVVAFRMLPKEVWSIPDKGTFNLHASLLPQYRGAAPINHAIINGEKQTGLTTFLIDEKIDTGKILEQLEMEIHSDESFGELHDRMMILGADLVLSTTRKIVQSTPETIDQQQLVKDESELKSAPKLSKEFCQINWNQTQYDVFNFIRGLSPYPAAYSWLLNQDDNPILVKIFKVDVFSDKCDVLPGEIKTDNKTFLDVAVADGYVRLHELQFMGKRRMSVKELLNGFKIKEGAFFAQQVKN